MTHRSQPLQDKVAIVMDAAHGAGAEIARRLAYAGVQVVINYRSVHRQAAHKVEEDIFASGGRAWAVPANPCSGTDCQFLLEQTVQGFGEPDFIVTTGAIATHDALISQFGVVANKIWQVQSPNNIVSHLPSDVQEALCRIIDAAMTSQSSIEAQEKGMTRQTRSSKNEEETSRERPWLPALERV